jgi:hydroxypyruvate reductase
MTQTAPRHLLMDLFRAAVDAADPMQCLPPHLPEPAVRGQTIVLAAGKAACAMAQAAEARYLGSVEDDLLSGLVVTRQGYQLPCQKFEVIVAGHPTPNANSVVAAERSLELARGASHDDLVVVLLSGGASALWAAPIEGVTLADKQRIGDQLLRSGASIGEINCVRKHLSRIKGGLLAKAIAPANLVTLAISDVAGDAPDVIGSGPTVADATTKDDALACLGRYGISLSEETVAALSRRSSDAPGKDDPVFASTTYTIVASPAQAMEAAAKLAEQRGYASMIVGSDLEDEARSLAQQHASLARKAHKQGTGCVLLSGGEATVTLTGSGRGGPNQEFALALACALEGLEGIWALAADSDGTDGGSGESNDPAGAIIGPHTLSRARERGLDPQKFLENNDSTSFFSAIEDLLVTGPTFTNVNDFRAILVEP